jgi:hypothetical protein
MRRGTGVHGAAIKVKKEACAVKSAVLLFCCAAMPSLSKAIVAAPAETGMLTPPMPMIAGYGAVPLIGTWIVAEKVIDLLLFEATTVSLPPAKEPVTTRRIIVDLGYDNATLRVHFGRFTHSCIKVFRMIS